MTDNNHLFKHQIWTSAAYYTFSGHYLMLPRPSYEMRVSFREKDDSQKTFFPNKPKMVEGKKMETNKIFLKEIACP